MRETKQYRKPSQFLILLHNLSKGGREMVPLNIIARELKLRPVDLQKIVNQYAKHGLVRYEPPASVDNPAQMGGVWLTTIGISKVENT